MVDPVTVALAAKTASDVFSSGLGSLWGSKRPKVPKELGQISQELLQLARGLPNAPAALSRLATALEQGANLWEQPPEALEELARVAQDSSADIARSADNIGRYADDAGQDLIARGERYGRMGHRAAVTAYDDSGRARELHADWYRPVEEGAAADALSAGSEYEQDERARHAGDLSEEALAVAQAQAHDAASLRGAGSPTAAAMTNPAATASGADMIAKARYNAGEDERRLGFNMRQALLPYAGDVSDRGIRYGNQANTLANSAQLLRAGGVDTAQKLYQGQAGLYGSAQELADGSQRLNLRPWEAGNQYLKNKQQSQIYGINAHSTAHDADLRTATTRSGLLKDSYDAFSKTHAKKSSYWQGRTNDLKKGIGGVTNSLVAGVATLPRAAAAAASTLLSLRHNRGAACIHSTILTHSTPCRRRGSPYLRGRSSAQKETSARGYGSRAGS